MNENLNRSYSKSPARDATIYQNAIRNQHSLHQQEYEQFHRDRAIQFREIENSQTDKFRETDGDRTALIKRINGLLVEVERLSHEKNELTAALHEERIASNEVHRMAKSSGKAKNIIDRNLQSDLKFEKEENSRLRHLLHQIELERAELRSKLKDYELASSSSTYEKKELICKLQQKTDQVLIFEADNRALNEKNLFLQSRVNDLEHENATIIHERSNLCETLSRMEVERMEIIKKLHEEIARYENFQIIKNSEIDNMKWVQKRHCRVLASRNIALELQKMTCKVYNYGLSRIKDSVFYESAKWRGTQKIVANLFKFYDRRVKSCFDSWRGKLNWRSTQLARMNLVDIYSRKGTQAKIFSEWRNLMLSKLKDKRQKILCLTVLSKLFKDKIESSIRTRFIQFKTFAMGNRRKDFQGSKLTIRAFVGKLRSAISKWQRFNEKMKAAQSREDLAVDFAASLLRSRYFFAFKEYTKLRKKDREILSMKEDHADKVYQINILNELNRYTQRKSLRDTIVRKMVKRWIRKDQYRAVSTWKSEVKTMKKIEKVEFYLRGNDLTKSHLVKEKLFFAWKNFIITNKLQRTQEELNYEKPLREKYENLHKDVIEEKQRIHNIKVGRMFAKCFRGELFSYFTHWREHTEYFREAKPRIKRMILKEYIFKIGSAFRKWKDSISTINYRDLHLENLKYAETNSILLEHITNLEETLSFQLGKTQDMTRQSMKRVILRIQNFKLATYMRTWAQNAFTTSNMLSGAMIIERKLRNFLYRRSLVAILNKSINNKRKWFAKRKMNNFILMQMRGGVLTTFSSWKNFWEIRKQFKQMFIKIAHRKGMTNKQIYMNKFKAKMKALRETELLNETYRLATEKASLENTLERLTDDFNQESARSAKFLKNLKKRSRLRIANALIRCSQGCRKVYWDRWIGMIKFKDLKLDKMGRLRKLWDKNREKKAWRTWMIYIKNKFETISKIEMNGIKKQAKIQKRVAKGTEEVLKKQIEDRENIISECEKKIAFEEKVKEFLLDRSVKQFESEYSENRAAFAFKVMKERFQGIKHQVSKFSQLFHFLRKKNAFISIKSKARQTYQLNMVEDLLIGLCKKYRLRYLRNKFDMWHRNCNKLLFDGLSAKIKTDNNKINELKMIQRKIQKTNMVKMFSVLMSKEKGNVFSSWVKTTKKIKAIRLASQKFAVVRKNMKTGFAVCKMIEFTKNSKRELNKAHMASNNYMSKLIKRVFKSWKSLHDIGAYVKIVFGGVNKRYYRDSLYTGLGAIKAYASHQSTKSEWKDKSQNSSVNRILYTMAKRTVFPYFQKWQNFIGFKLTAQGKVRRTILRALTRKFRSAFDLWTECLKLRKTFENVNKEGPVAIENSFLRDRNEILTKLIKDEGIDPKYVEQYINERESLKAALKRKGINRLRYKAGLINPNDNTIMPRIFTTWKLWVIKRKRLVHAAHRMLAFKRKPDLLHGFLTWKKGFPLVVNTINKLPRRELYSLVAKMDRDIKTLEGRLENSNSDLVYMNAYSEVLQTHTKRGQNLAMVMGKHNTHKTFYRVFLRWTMHTNLCKIHDLLANLTGVEESLYITKTTLRAMDEDNQVMMEENLNLRQASLDGIAIAEAFETLSKERERLSVDLAERTATIKKLLEHNNELAMRLKQFSAEDKFFTPDRESKRQSSVL
ncbi:hypothetical protein SteCoe_905 [Stentor coeruleus]|uniref:Uncharacterized protein n=1 Tax=Stentor coeruleus TaxID=5963 RepID=A0A1R2D331_9CILI|nr:hypothetical protein SteCoe_905 [Stentor coeruleus]